MDLSRFVNWDEPSFWISAGSIVFNPTFWNVAARQEYRNKTITKFAGGNPTLGCYVLGATIFSLGILRDYLFERALRSQPEMAALTDFPLRQPLAALLFATGIILVVSSMWALGVTGTYLGDYFGILMDSKVTGFPFNVSSCPMYLGSTLSFVGTALWYGKPAGLVLSVLVAGMYWIALKFEDPFTSMIYANRDKDRRKKSS